MDAFKLVYVYKRNALGYIIDMIKFQLIDRRLKMLLNISKITILVLKYNSIIGVLFVQRYIYQINRISILIFVHTFINIPLSTTAQQKGLNLHAELKCFSYHIELCT